MVIDVQAGEKHLVNGEYLPIVRPNAEHIALPFCILYCKFNFSTNMLP